MTKVNAVVQTTPHWLIASQCKRHAGSPTLTAPSSVTPWASSDSATVKIVATAIAPSAQGRRALIFSPTSKTAKVPRASATDQPLT